MNIFVRFCRIVGSAAYRFYWDDCFSRAAALAYTTLFSLVPVAALALSMYTAFGFKPEEFDLLLKTILEQLLPPAAADQIGTFQQQVFEYIEMFTRVIAGKALNAVSVGVLIFSGIALLNTIESAMNVIWRVAADMAIMAKIVRFWAVITLGPVLIGISIYWTAQFKAMTADTLIGQTLLQGFVNFAFPVFVTFIALLLLYVTLPNAKVRIRDGALGALVTALLFEMVKEGFAFYLAKSTTYSTFYGVLASIPLFLFWLYIAWVVVLYGAEIAYQSGSIEIGYKRRKFATDLGEIGGFLGLRILHVIGERFLAGKEGPTESEIAIETGTDPVLVRTCLQLLSDAKIITAGDDERHSRSLRVAPEKLSLAKIFDTFFTERYLESDQAEKEAEERGQFLEYIRLASLGAPTDKAPLEWNLREFVELSKAG